MGAQIHKQTNIQQQPSSKNNIEKNYTTQVGKKRKFVWHKKKSA